MIEWNGGIGSMFVTLIQDKVEEEEEDIVIYISDENILVYSSMDVV